MLIACPSPPSMTMMRVLSGLTIFRFATVAAVTWKASWSAFRTLRRNNCLRISERSDVERRDSVASNHTR